MIRLLALAVLMMAASCKIGNATTVCIDADWIQSEGSRGALAMSDGLIALGDAETNTVRVFERQSDTSLRHLRDILAPAGSPFDRLGRGFGYDLAMDGGRLVIGAFAAPDEDLPLRVWTALTPGARIGAVYSVDIAGGGPPRRLFPDAIEVIGFDVSAQNGEVAASAIRLTDEGRAEGGVLITREGETRTVSPPAGSSALAFGYAISLSGSRLGVGAPQEGGAWFYDRKTLVDPTFLTGEPGTTGFAGTGVAVGESFAAVSAATGMGVLRTTVHRASQDAVVLNRGGRLSSVGDLLLISQPASDDSERSPSVSAYRVMDAGVEEIKTWSGAIAAAVGSNGWVATIRPKEERALCLEKII